MCADQILAKQARISELSRISKDHTHRERGCFGRDKNLSYC